MLVTVFIKEPLETGLRNQGQDDLGSSIWKGWLKPGEFIKLFKESSFS